MGVTIHFEGRLKDVLAEARVIAVARSFRRCFVLNEMPKVPFGCQAVESWTTQVRSERGCRTRGRS